jgi:hypothetical protein
MQVADTGDDEDDEEEGISTVIVQQEDNSHKKVSMSKHDYAAESGPRLCA